MSTKDPYEKFMDRPLGAVQGDLALLDLIKGLEAYASIACAGVMAEYREFDVEQLPEDAPDSAEDAPEPKPIDDLHHFARECRRMAKGLRQQLEQRMFGGVKHLMSISTCGACGVRYRGDHDCPGSIEDRISNLEERVEVIEQEEKPMSPMTHEEKLIYAMTFSAAALSDRNPTFAANQVLGKYRKRLQILLAGEPTTDEERMLLAFAGRTS